VSERCQHCGAALTKLSDRIEALQAQLKAVRECDQFEISLLPDGPLVKVMFAGEVILAAQEAGNSSKKQNLGFRDTVGGMLKDNDTGEVSEPTTTDLSDFPEDLK
jgi:hypothetical protein